MNRRSLFFALVMAIGIASVALAAADQTDRPDFSGEWILDLGRSDLARQLRGVTSGVVRIEHREPSFSFFRTFVDRGKESTTSWTLTTDGKEIARDEGGMPVRQSLAWDGSELVFVAIYQSPRGEASDTVRYTLLDGGSTLRAEETFRGPRLQYRNVWVFTKKP